MIKIDFSKRIYGLDILRCFAIITVLYNHSYIYANHVISQNIYTYFNFDGVSLFFVLSGFLIGIILIKALEKSKASYPALKVFWIRRWFRTLPLYFLVLFTIAIFNTLTKDPKFILHLKTYFFFLQNFYSFKGGIFITSWSLSVEEWFYLIVPLMLWGGIKLLKISTKRALQFVIIFFLVFCPVLRYFRLEQLLANGGYGEDRFSFTVLCRLDAIMFGLTASYFYVFHTNFWEKGKMYFLSIGVVIIVVDYILSILGAPYGFKDSPVYKHVIHYTLLPIAILFIMPFFNSINKGKGFLAYVVTLFSMVSYSLYLLHNSVVMPMIIPVIAKPLVSMFSVQVAYSIIYILFWAISLSLAILVYKYYEFPMTNMRDKFKYLGKLKTVKQAESEIDHQADAALPNELNVLIKHPKQ